MPRRIHPTREDHAIAALASLAVVIHIAEAAVPSPLPGVRPGLANVVVLAVLLIHGWRAAVWVALLRVVAGGLLLGTFLSPTFMLSLTGALVALAALWLGQRLPGIGPVGLSVLASLAHTSGQFLLAWAWLVPHPGLLALLPVLLAAALGLGILNGILTAGLVRALGAGGTRAGMAER